MRNCGSPTKWVFCAAEFLRRPVEVSASQCPMILFFISMSGVGYSFMLQTFS